MARCLVLGANGFIGSHLVDSLVDAGHTIRAFDRFGDSPIRFNAHDAIEKVSGDFLNREDLRTAVKDVDYVFHLVSTTTPITAENDPVMDVATNVTTSIELFKDCVDAGVKKVIFASTGGAMYGKYDSRKPLSESANPQPISPYAIGKLTIEHYLRYFRVKYGLDSLTLRISNPYGERQPIGRKQGVIPIFLEKICADEPVVVLGDGSMVRDYIYVKDVAQIIASIFERDNAHEVYNLGSGMGTSVGELIEAMERLTGRQIKKEYRPAPPTFVQSVVLDSQRIMQEFDVVPQTSLEDGLEKTWNYICANVNAEK